MYYAIVCTVYKLKRLGANHQNSNYTEDFQLALQNYTYAMQ